MRPCNLSASMALRVSRHQGAGVEAAQGRVGLVLHTLAQRVVVSALFCMTRHKPTRLTD